MTVAQSAVEPLAPNSTLECVGLKGVVRDTSVKDADRTITVAMHLSPLGFFVIGPLAFLTPVILWLVRKQESAFADDHGRETINFMISYLVIGLLLCWTFVVPAVLIVVGIISMIRGAVASGRGEFFRYPMTIRFLS